MISALRSRKLRPVIVVLATMLLLSIGRVIGNADDLTSSLTFSAALGFTTPIVLAGLGALVSERVGIVNLGVEGTLTLGAWFAGWFGYYGGPWLALVGGVVGGLIGGALHGLATIKFAVDQTVSGVAINLLAPALARYLSKLAFDGVSDGTLANSPTMSSMNRFSLPIIGGGRIGSWQAGDPLGWLERRHWFFVSDVAGLVKGFAADLSMSTIVLLSLFPIVGYLIWRTPWGLRLRSSGEKPGAADSLGINVTAIRWQGVLLSGTLAGLGGAWQSINDGKYQQAATATKGYLGIAAVIFGNWMPLTLFAGALLLSFPTALRYALGDEPPRAFLVTVALAFGFIAVRSMIGANRNVREAVATGVLAVAMALFFVQVRKVDESLVQAYPYLITLMVLVFSSTRLRPPKASGVPWLKGQST